LRSIVLRMLPANLLCIALHESNQVHRKGVKDTEVSECLPRRHKDTKKIQDVRRAKKIKNVVSSWQKGDQK
jgi:hypothetical protein